MLNASSQKCPHSRGGEGLLCFLGGNGRDEGELNISVHRSKVRYSNFLFAQIPLEYFREVMDVMKVDRQTRSDGGEGRDATERHTRAPALGPIRWMGEMEVDGGTGELLQKCGRSQRESFLTQKKWGSAKSDFGGGRVQIVYAICGHNYLDPDRLYFSPSPFLHAQ